MATDAQKVRLLCSFGGKILPRPTDGALRYAGGHTRILSLRRSSTLEDFLHKASQMSNGVFNAVKYQLPEDDLDALISISSQEDLDNMMEEFDRVNVVSNDGSARIRIFLFSLSDLGDPKEAIDTGQSYIEAVNGVGIKRKDSLVCASSGEGMSSLTLSPTHVSIGQDSLRLGFPRDETLVCNRIENQNVNADNVHSVYVNADSVVSAGGNADWIQRKIESLGGVADQTSNFGGNLMPVQVKFESFGIGGHQISSFGGNLMHNQGKIESMAVACDHMSNFRGNLMINQGMVEENLYKADQNRNNGNCSGNSQGIHLQPLNQLPPLHLSHIHPLAKSYVPPLHPMPQHKLRLDDCQLCQKSLPHAHSDMLVNDNAKGIGSGSGSSAIHKARPVLQSHHSEDPTRLQASIRPENVIELKVQAAAVAAGQLSHQRENERAFHPNVEALHPPGISRMADPTRMQLPLTGAMAEGIPKVETAATGCQFGSCGFAPEISHLHENETLVHPKVEAFDPPKVLHRSTTVSGASADSKVEPKIDTVAAPSHVEARGFVQTSKIPQQHDNERLLINLNVPALAMVGLQGDTQASHGVFANPLQSHFPHPFQAMPHNMVARHNLVKQDVVTKQLGPVVSSTKNGIYKAAEPPSRVPVPEISHDHVRPLNGMMESLHVSTFEPSVFPEHSRPADAVNRGASILKPEDFTLMVEKNHVVRPPLEENGVFLGNPHFMSGIVSEGNSVRPLNQLPPSSAELKPEHSLVSAYNSQTFRSQAGGEVIYIGNASIASGIVPDGNSFIPINQMPPTSLSFTRLQTLLPAETGRASRVMANHGPLLSYSQEMRVRLGIPNEQLHAMPSCAGGATSLYNNSNTVNVMPVRDRTDETSWRHPKDVLINVSAPSSHNAPINYSNASGRNGHAEEFQGPTPSESLFCIHDPRKIIGNLQMVHPKQTKCLGESLLRL